MKAIYETPKVEIMYFDLAIRTDDGVSGGTELPEFPLE